MRIYLDNASTTPMDSRVFDHIKPLMTDTFGNPSSIHYHGRQTKALIEVARKTIANGLKASISEIFFTSSATEANNMVLMSSVRDHGVQRIISSPTEHHCVLHSIDYLKENHDVECTMLSVDHHGVIDYEQLRTELKSSTKKTIVSLMHANNEIGSLSDPATISEICTEYDALYHCDAVQTVAKYPINVGDTKFSFLSGSAHKFYGPKGVGFIYINGENKIKPLIYGGAQERNMRAGTENTYGIAGIGKAFELGISEMDTRTQSTRELRQYLIDGVCDISDKIKLNGSIDGHYCIANISFPKNSKTDLIMFNLDIAGISASAGSACSSGIESRSHVLDAISLPDDENAVRFSLSHHNTRGEVDYLIDKLKGMI